MSVCIIATPRGMPVSVISPVGTELAKGVSMPDRDVIENTGAVHRRDLARLLRVLLAVVVVVALVLVGIDNRSKVRIGYVFGHAQAPVWVVIVGSALAGMIIAALARSNRR